MDRVELMKRIVMALALGIVLGGCTMDVETQPWEKGGSDDKATVRFNINTPASMRQVTRDAVFDNGEFDYGMNDLLIMVLNKSGNDYLFSYAVQGVRQPESSGDAYTTFDADLFSSQTPIKLLVLANHGESYSGVDVVNNLPAKGVTEAQLRSMFVTTQMPSDVVPMSGETILPSLEPFSSSTIEIDVMRMMARADIGKNLEPGSRPFTMTSVALYRPMDKMQLMPSLSALDTSDHTRVTSASEPGDAIPQPAVSLPFSFVNDNSTGQHYSSIMYIPESLPATTDDEKLNAMCLIVGGYYNGDTGKQVYYRVDFNSGEAGHPFGQVLRNTRYVFNITKVLSPGKDTPEEAALSTNTSMLVQVTAWNDNISQVNFVGTGDYIMVNTNNVVMPYNAGATQTFTVRSTLPFQWQLGSDGALVSSTASTEQNNGIYDVVITAGTPGPTYTDYTFTITNVSDNPGPDNRPTGVFITVNTAVLSVGITQQSSSGVTNRKVNVLSLSNDIGSLGVYYDSSHNTPAGGAAALKNILIDPTKFGPGGTVDFAGFTLDELQTGAANGPTTVSLDQLRRALVSTDILVMPYASDPYQDAVDMILEWLDSDKHHVLFVSGDAGADAEGTYDGVATNAILRNTLGATDGLKWYSGSKLNDETLLGSLLGGLIDGLLDILGLGALSGSPDVEVEGVKAAEPTDLNKTFVNGPFGEASHTVLTANPFDGIAEFAMPNDTSPVIPLAIFQTSITTKTVTQLPPFIRTDTETTDTDMMMMGVDPQRRIVYIGESQFASTYMSVGTVNTLMLNTWAWAANTVLAQ